MTIFELYGWSVIQHTNGNYLILDQDGCIQGASSTKEDAIGICEIDAIDCHRKVLWGNITKVDPNDISVEDLEKIAMLLHLDPALCPSWVNVSPQLPPKWVVDDASKFTRSPASAT